MCAHFWAQASKWKVHRTFQQKRVFVWTCSVTTAAHQSSPHTEKRLYFPKCFIRNFLRTQLRTFSTRPNSTRVIDIDLRKWVFRRNVMPQQFKHCHVENRCFVFCYWWSWCPILTSYKLLPGHICCTMAEPTLWTHVMHQNQPQVKCNVETCNYCYNLNIT